MLSLLEDEDSYGYDITRAREIASRTLQDAGICVEFDTQGDAFDDSLIVWGYYGAPIEAIERQEALDNRRVTALSVPAVRSWFRKPGPKRVEIAKPEKAEPETEPESERRIRWDWGLVMVELLILGGIAYIWSTQGRDHPALVPLCSLGVLVAISGLTVLAALEWEDSDE